MNLPSDQADAALAFRAAVDLHTDAVRSGDPERIATATAAYIAAEHRRLVLSDPRHASGQ